MTQTNKLVIAKYIDKNKDGIIQKYAENVPISKIAKLYRVAESTIYLRLVKWGIKIRKYIGPRRRRYEKSVRQKRKFSPELIARMKENSQINSKHIKHCEFKHTTGDQKLIANILKRL